MRSFHVEPRVREGSGRPRRVGGSRGDGRAGPGVPDEVTAGAIPPETPGGPPGGAALGHPSSRLDAARNARDASPEQPGLFESISGTLSSETHGRRTIAGSIGRAGKLTRRCGGVWRSRGRNVNARRRRGSSPGWRACRCCSWRSCPGCWPGGVILSSSTVNVLYRDVADRVVRGQVPYRDFPLEYPIGCLPQLVLPRLAGRGVVAYRTAYVAEMLLANAVLVLAIAREVGRREGRGGPVPAGLVPALLPVPLPADRQPARRRPGAPGPSWPRRVVRRDGRSAAACSRRSGAWSRLCRRWPSCRRDCGRSPGAADAAPRLDGVRGRLRDGHGGLGRHGGLRHAGRDPLPRGARAGDRVHGRGRARCSSAG